MKMRFGIGDGLRTIVFLLLASSAARANTDTWNNSGGGAYSTNGNWSANAPPGANDLAAFTLTSTYSVSFSANADFH